jgi:hypothetical protein
MAFRNDDPLGRLKLPAINARFESGLTGWLLAMVRSARWELICGFCKQRFRKVQFFGWSTIECPFCGTVNELPVSRFPSDPGPRPPDWPEYRPPSG